MARQNFDKEIELITEEITNIINSDVDFYRGYRVEITEELIYSKRIVYTPKTIYFCIKFLKTTMYYGQLNLPFTINVLAEQNSFDVCRSLVMDFISQYNLQKDSSGDILQRYETPMVLSNFNEVGNGFRTLFMFSGAFLISENTNPIKSIEYTWSKDVDGEIVEESEIIKPLTSSFTIKNQLDSQAFYETNNLTQSIGQIFSFIINFLTYQFTDSHLFKVMVGMVNGDSDVEGDVNYNFNDTIFHMTVTFKDDTVIEKDFRFVQMSGSQPIDGLPTDNYSFTC